MTALTLMICHEQGVLDEVAFGSMNVQAGQSVGFRDLPPRVSVVFRRMPASTFTATYRVSNQTTSLIGASHSFGFDSGNSTADFEVTMTADGKLSYVIVTFPKDCSQRIISTRLIDAVQHGASPGKVCFFNGASRRLNYRIFVSTEENGSLRAQQLSLQMRGEGVQTLENVPASLFTWENVRRLAIQVQGDGVDRGFSQMRNSTEPGFLFNERGDSKEAYFRGRDRPEMALDFGCGDPNNYCSATVVRLIATHAIRVCGKWASVVAVGYLSWRKYRSGQSVVPSLPNGAAPLQNDS
jgi:hypothetical protein